jgi:hypothetical protein
MVRPFPELDFFEPGGKLAHGLKDVNSSYRAKTYKSVTYSLSVLLQLRRV